MLKSRTIALISALILASAAATTPLQGQTRWILDPISENYYPARERLYRDVEFLCDTLLQGRARGTSGHGEAIFYLNRRFTMEGLKPFAGTFVQPFRLGDTDEVGHNIVGMIEGSRTGVNRKYIIIGAHYDHIGTIKGTVYPGADASASGVAALLGIAHAFRCQREAGFTYGTNLIFVAFDAYTDGREGGRALYRSIERGNLVDPCTGIRITPDQITMMVDLDQIGSTLKPVNKLRPEYLMAIDMGSVPRSRETLERANKLYGTRLTLYDSYYGSERFTQVFYNLGDRKHFISRGIPTIYFTSGITPLTNTPRDDAQSLNYDVLSRRATLIFRFIEKYL